MISVSPTGWPSKRSTASRFRRIFGRFSTSAASADVFVRVYSVTGDGGTFDIVASMERQR